MGAWLTYGLGSENRDLPGFVVLISGENNPDGGKSCWGSGFLPTVYQGVELRNSGDPVLFLDRPAGRRRARPAATRSTCCASSTSAASRRRATPRSRRASRAYELAYRMQTSVPELADIASEPASVHELYGTEPGKVSFANNCLLARRLVERGVRFVQLYHRGWDHHGTGTGDDIVNSLPKLCREVDQAAAALVKDLEAARPARRDARRLGRRVRAHADERGPQQLEVPRPRPPPARVHDLDGGRRHPAGDVVLGATDELGYNPVEDPVDVHDLHATILHLLGLDHTKLTYRFQGRDFRLTDVSGQRVTKLLA